MSDDTLFDVAIVGFGPSGGVAAALLGQAGFKVHVCDAQHEVYAKPRAIALDHEILRLFQQIGVAEQVAPFMEPFTDSCFHGVDGQLIRRMTMLAPPYPQGYTPSMVFTQPPVERALRERVRALPTVTVQTGWKLRAVQQDDHAVTLHLTDERDGTQIVRARYVIACDGASSTTRGLLGVGLHDLGFDEPWLVVDVQANAQGLAKLPTTSMQYCEPERPCSYVIGPGNHRRWEISLKEGEDPQQAASPEGTWALLSRWLTPEDGTLWRQAAYRFHALVAERWRVGRVFLAGDAAHQQPPFLGQGMCQGLRDVANLSWKLSRALQGRAGDALLDSYGQERAAHVTALTRKLKSIGALICERDPAKARARDVQLLADGGGQVRPTPRQDVLPRLECGLLAAQDNSARGTLFPQPWLCARSNGQVPAQRMDALLGRGWRLVTQANLGPLDAELLKALEITVLTLGPQERWQETEGVLAAWFERHGCSAALVRPDHYVYGVAADAQGLQSLLAAAHLDLCETAAALT